MIGRNDPCPCGSGKKYKKCCALKNEVSSDALVESELKRVLVSYFEYATDSPIQYAEFEHYERMWRGKLQRHFSEDNLYSAVMSYFLFVLNRDLWNRYLVKTLNGPIRSATRSVLETWKNPIVLLGKITSVDRDYFYAEELLGHQTFTIHLDAEFDPEESELVFGIVLPDKRKHENGVYPLEGLSLIGDHDGSLSRRIVSMAEESEMSSSHEFFKTYMLDLYVETFEFDDNDEVDIDDIVGEELSPAEQEVVVILEDKLEEHYLPPQLVDFIKMIAIGYFMRKPNFRKPEVVAAAIFQVVNELDWIEGEFYSQEKTAEMFGVSASSMRKHIEHIYPVIDDMNEIIRKQMDEGPTFAYNIGTDPSITERMNWEIHCKASAQPFDSLEDFQVRLDETMNQPFKPIGKRQEAQALAYDAYEAGDINERIRLAKKILVLDPENVDGILFQAEMAKARSEAESYLKEAIRLGEAEFNSEPENPWALVTNRPYMRARFTYGIWLYEKSLFDEALDQFEKLLEMNPNDNQGARYLAISSAIKNGDYIIANRLLGEYEDISSDEAPYIYMEWLLEAMSEGVDFLSVDEYIDVATEMNMFVLGLIEDGLPKFTYPKQFSISPGSIEEAMYIWYLL